MAHVTVTADLSLVPVLPAQEASVLFQSLPLFSLPFNLSFVLSVLRSVPSVTVRLPDDSPPAPPPRRIILFVLCGVLKHVEQRITQHGSTP